MSNLILLLVVAILVISLIAFLCREKPLQVLPEDFDRACSVPWSPDTCLMAQACLRHYGSLDSLYSSRHASLMGAFDNHKVYSGAYRGYPDKDHPEMQRLRASLPVTLK